MYIYNYSVNFADCLQSIYLFVERKIYKQIKLSLMIYEGYEGSDHCGENLRNRLSGYLNQSICQKHIKPY